MSRFIVLEGVDGAGKTTLAKSICTRYGYQYHHVGPPGAQLPDTSGDFFGLVKAYWEAPWTQGHVWDRGHLGESFCGPVRRGTQPTSTFLNVFNAIMAEREGMTLILDPDQDELDEAGVVEQLHLHDTFLCLKQIMPWTYYYNGPRSQVTTNAWHDVARYNKLAVRHLAEEDPYGIGGRSPEWWVLGEQTNPNSICSVPFLTASGMALVWPAIERPVKVRLSNAMGPDRPEYSLQRSRQSPESWLMVELRHRWELLGKPKVITLGDTARNTCAEAGVPIEKMMRHPQYVYRFLHGQINSWTDELREVLR